MNRSSKNQAVSVLNQTMSQKGVLHRKDVLFRIKKLLRKTPKSPTALELITLFHVQAEELTEIGMDYEAVCTLGEWLTATK